MPKKMVKKKEKDINGFPKQLFVANYYGITAHRLRQDAEKMNDKKDPSLTATYKLEKIVSTKLVTATKEIYKAKK